MPTLTVAEDLLLPAVGRGPLSRFGLLDQRRIHAESRRLIDDYDIRTPGPDALVGSLSGGNQQKVVLARELREQPGIIVACYPTRGLDFAATEAVRRVLIDRAASGAAVLYVSTDLDELLTVSHRIIVLAHGRIAGHLDASEASAERLGLLMGGTAA